jgi:hypothetical protein
MAANDVNSMEWRSEKYKMVILDSTGKEVASTEFTVKGIDSNNPTWLGTGMFVQDKLVGSSGRSRAAFQDFFNFAQRIFVRHVP